MVDQFVGAPDTLAFDAGFSATVVATPGSGVVAGGLAWHTWSCCGLIFTGVLVVASSGTAGLVAVPVAAGASTLV